MCGRFSLMAVAQALSDRFNAEISEPVIPRYNISPGQDALVILNSSPDMISHARWGLVPHWSKDVKVGYKMINAKAETIQEKSAYKAPFQRSRCLIPADGFYEWKAEGKAKVPYRITYGDGRIFAFAGIFDVWKEASGKEIVSFSIITTVPNDVVRPIHDRMPAILLKDEEQAWLKESDTGVLMSIINSPRPADGMKAYRVSTLVNSPQNDSPDVVKPHTDVTLGMF